MKIAVIGASGFVGDAVVRELAMRGHDVTAFARNAANIFSASNVLAVATDVNDADFAARLAGFDAVISAFNGGWTNPNLIADFRRGYAAILAAAQSANVPYLLVVGGAGNLYVAPGVRLIDTPQFPQEILDVGKAERDLLHDLLAADGLNWAMICPPACFSPENSAALPRMGRYRLGDETLLMDGDKPANISRADIAVAIADDVEQKAHLHKNFTVASI